ncbi:hypothetical protein C8Q79DRAFT_1011721 [Trametes meyenii]|nr:hypothetical protein C8Q79DRAFT_1011721 [Trametes meyenii]
MAAVFRQFFGCCIRSRPPNPEEPDERTPFIQPTDEVPPILTYTVDHDRMRERLGTIVRSKEGKMVNVNQPLPFNLHGRPPHARPDRSLSANTTPPRASSSAGPTPESSTAAGKGQQPRLPSYSPSREPSPSIQTSRSTSSLHPGDASYLPPEADPENGHRRPILNVRLVRGPGGFMPLGGRPRQGPATARGRSGRPNEERGRENGGEAEGLEAARGNSMAATNSVNRASNASSLRNGEASNTDHDTAAHTANSADGSDSNDSAAQDEPSALDSEFKIEDVGDISQSWGD